MTQIIAELSGNHGGDLVKCEELIFAAAKSGCSAAKVQCYVPEDLDRENAELYKKLQIPLNWYPLLFETARMAGIPLLASVFAVWAVRFLERFRPQCLKIASPESTRLTRDTYLDIAYEVKHLGIPLWVSTGISDYDFMRQLEPDVLFYCKAGYPATIDEADLGFVSRFKCGFSDHTAGITDTLRMIEAGASHIEKHFKLDDDCVDAAFSLNPEQMQQLCRTK